MRRNTLLGLLALLPYPCSAAKPAVPAKLSISARQSAKADIRLRSWMQTQPGISKGLAAAIEREAAWRPAMDPDLRDAVSDSPPLHDRIQVAEGKKRQSLLSALPGLKVPEAPTCADLKDCPLPPLAVDVDDSEHLRLAIRSLIRPWLLLQQARGGPLALEAAGGEGEKILSFSIPELSLKDVGVNITAKPEGGYHIWLDQALVLSSVYGQQRDAVLSAAIR